MKRGQVDAPIELFVAVIILMASMSLAFYLMNQTNESKCIAQLKTETDKLQSAMLDIALASPPTSRTITFEMPRCGSVNVEVLQFVYYSSPEYCRLCPAHYGGCWQIVPISVDRYGQYSVVSDAVSCVQMSGDLWIDDEGCDSDSINLGDSPCPYGETQCDFEKTSVSNSVLENSRWATLGKETGSNIYKITLTKTTRLTGGSEAGAIRVCAKPANKA